MNDGRDRARDGLPPPATPYLPVQTVGGQVGSLSEIRWGFRPYRIPERNYIQFLRESDRTWQNVTWITSATGRFPLLLQGWIVRLFRGAGRAPVFALVCEDKLETLPAASIDERLAGKKLPQVELSLLADSEHLYLDISDTWFPTGLYRLLSDLSPRHETLRLNDEVAFWQFRKADWDRVNAALARYQVRATLLDQASWEQRRRFAASVHRPVQLVSRILEESYSGYLKREGSTSHLRNDLALSATQPLPWGELQPLWAELKDQAAADPVSRAAVDFISGYLATSYDWKRERELGHSSELSGLILGVEFSRFGKSFAGNYFRLYVPAFASVLQLRTTVNPTGSTGTRTDPSSAFLRRMWIEKWRVLPYLGVLKNTGDSSTLGLDLRGQDYSDSAVYMASLPTFEAALCELARFQNFDMDRNEWNAGYTPLSRTFLAELQVRASLDSFSSAPAIFARDVLGTPFQLEFDYHDYDRRRRFLKGLRTGDWIALVTTTRLESRAVQRPVRFRLGVLPYYRISTISEADAGSISAFGLTKLFHDVGPEGVAALSDAWDGGAPLASSLDRLRTEGKLLRGLDAIFTYVPESVSFRSVEQFEALRRGERSAILGGFKQTAEYRRLATLWRLREKAHPLVEPRIALDQELRNSGALAAVPKAREFVSLEHRRVTGELSKLAERFQSRASRGKQLTVTRTSEPQALARLACWELEKAGEVSFRAAGGAIEPAYDTLDRLEHDLAYLSPRTEIRAEWVRSPDDRPVRAVNLRVSVPGLT